MQIQQLTTWTYSADADIGIEGKGHDKVLLRMELVGVYGHDVVVVDDPALVPRLDQAMCAHQQKATLATRYCVDIVSNGEFAK